MTEKRNRECKNCGCPMRDNRHQDFPLNTHREICICNNAEY